MVVSDYITVIGIYKSAAEARAAVFCDNDRDDGIYNAVNKVCKRCAVGGYFHNIFILTESCDKKRSKEREADGEKAGHNYCISQRAAATLFLLCRFIRFYLFGKAPIFLHLCDRCGSLCRGFGGSGGFGIFFCVLFCSGFGKDFRGRFNSCFFLRFGHFFTDNLFIVFVH